jgi:exodeoxyribonuclease VII small subunit
MPKPDTPGPRTAEPLAEGSDRVGAPASPAGFESNQDPETIPPSATSNGAGSGPTPVGFEQALAELEMIVARMESAELTLEESLAAYKRGVALLQYCQVALKGAQQQVKVLESGVLRDFTDADDDGR